MLTHGIPSDVHGGVHIFLPAPHTIGPVPSLSGHAIAYRWRSLPRVRWHKASSPQGSSSNGCCLCITMDQMLLCSSLFPSPLLVRREYVQIIGSVDYQNISTAVLFCGTVFPPRPMASTSVKSPVYTVQYHPLCVKTLSRLYYCCIMDPFSSPRLMPVQGVKSLVYTRYNFICCISKHNYYCCP